MNLRTLELLDGASGVGAFSDAPPRIRRSARGHLRQADALRQRRLLEGVVHAYEQRRPFLETLEESFSAVSTPRIARNGVVLRISRDLQDL